MHPQPVPFVGGNDKPKGYFQNTGNHHFHHPTMASLLLH
ncbi:hypothetical protein JCM19232_1551 [Vibrio ishigakensis]|uniref:Uncharacterized protein n=1 Tax=Vibrio ishigakensis TaxID=1481914 RepID=A0A0B8PL40_9VIBR|nr:hypothetical protein JCM19232_1551 [Vibrio ishigakensis]